VLVGGLIDLVVGLRLKEEVPCLTGGHRHQPGEQGSGNRIYQQQRIGTDKAECADKVQRLVDAAVMVVAVVIPPLDAQCLKKVVHDSSGVR
jgi:hypothetical protein